MPDVRFRLHVSEVRDCDTYQFVRAHAVYSADPNDPNYSFSNATPQAELRFTITNPAAFGVFQARKFYDFTATEAVIEQPVDLVQTQEEVNLTTDAVQALTSTDVLALTSTEVPTLATTDVQALTTTQVTALTTDAVQALTSTEVPALATTDVQALATTQVTALTTDAAQALTTTEAPALTTTQAN